MNNSHEEIENLEREIKRYKKLHNDVYVDYFRPYKKAIEILDDIIEDIIGKDSTYNSVMRNLWDALNMKGYDIPQTVIRNYILSKGYRTEYNTL